MAAKLASSRYGKGEVKVKKVTRHKDYHELIDFAVSVYCEGDFTDAHLKGDNSAVLPTDTQRNTIYILAKDHPLDSIESFGIFLSDHLLKANTQFTSVQVEIAQNIWERIPVNGKKHPTTYRKAGQEQWLTAVHRTHDSLAVQSGIRDLEILKTTDSGFSDFKVDDFTTLKDTDDRVLNTVLKSIWPYKSTDVDFAKERQTIQTTLLDAFAGHKSLSVQHTLYAMGEQVLAKTKAIDSISLEMPNVHNLLFDLSRFNRENKSEIFHVTEEPYGIITGVVSR